MGKKHILFFDVDHTLYNPNTKSVPQSSIDALARVKARGDTRLVIATGRAYYMLEVIDAIKPFFDAFITINGQIIFADGTMIHDDPMDETLVQKAKTIFEREALTYGFIGSQTQAVNQKSAYVEAMFEEQNLPYPVEDPAFDMHHDVYQMWAFADAPHLKIIESHFDNRVVVPWLTDGFDIIAPGKDKREGVMRILKHYGVDAHQAVCFGDGANDAAMLEAMPVSVAMGNATKDVKARATHVTDTFCNDGIAKALKKLGYIR